VVSEEIQPFIVYRIHNGQLECAFWQLQDGTKALALFLAEASAISYTRAANLSPDWKIFRPQREGLLEIIEGCRQAQIHFAVLDPDHEKAKMIFDLREIFKK
jgi:hypothetical protein